MDILLRIYGSLQSGDNELIKSATENLGYNVTSDPEGTLNLFNQIFSSFHQNVSKYDYNFVAFCLVQVKNFFTSNYFFPSEILGKNLDNIMNLLLNMSSNIFSCLFLDIDIITNTSISALSILYNYMGGNFKHIFGELSNRLNNDRFTESQKCKALSLFSYLISNYSGHHYYELYKSIDGHISTMLSVKLFLPDLPLTSHHCIFIIEAFDCLFKTDLDCYKTVDFQSKLMDYCQVLYGYIDSPQHLEGFLKFVLNNIKRLYDTDQGFIHADTVFANIFNIQKEAIHVKQLYTILFFKDFVSFEKHRRAKNMTINSYIKLKTSENMEIRHDEPILSDNYQFKNLSSNFAVFFPSFLGYFKIIDDIDINDEDLEDTSISYCAMKLVSDLLFINSDMFLPILHEFVENSLSLGTKIGYFSSLLSLRALFNQHIDSNINYISNVNDIIFLPNNLAFIIDMISGDDNFLSYNGLTVLNLVCSKLSLTNRLEIVLEIFNLIDIMLKRHPKLLSIYIGSINKILQKNRIENHYFKKILSDKVLPILTDMINLSFYKSLVFHLSDNIFALIITIFTYMRSGSIIEMIHGFTSNVMDIFSECIISTSIDTYQKNQMQKSILYYINQITLRYKDLNHELIFKIVYILRNIITNDSLMVNIDLDLIVVFYTTLNLLEENIPEGLLEGILDLVQTWIRIGSPEFSARGILLLGVIFRLNKQLLLNDLFNIIDVITCMIKQNNYPRHLEIYLVKSVSDFLEYMNMDDIETKQLIQLILEMGKVYISVATSTKPKSEHDKGKIEDDDDIFDTLFEGMKNLLKFTSKEILDDVIISNKKMIISVFDSYKNYKELYIEESRSLERFCYLMKHLSKTLPKNYSIIINRTSYKNIILYARCLYGTSKNIAKEAWDIICKF